MPPRQRVRCGPISSGCGDTQKRLGFSSVISSDVPRRGTESNYRRLERPLLWMAPRASGLSASEQETTASGKRGSPQRRRRSQFDNRPTPATALGAPFGVDNPAIRAVWTCPVRRRHGRSVSSRHGNGRLSDTSDACARLGQAGRGAVGTGTETPRWLRDPTAFPRSHPVAGRHNTGGACGEYRRPG